jgi:hypothetical protein
MKLEYKINRLFEDIFQPMSGKELKDVETIGSFENKREAMKWLKTPKYYQIYSNGYIRADVTKHQPFVMKKFEPVKSIEDYSIMFNWLYDYLNKRVNKYKRYKNDIENSLSPELRDRYRLTEEDRESSLEYHREKRAESMINYIDNHSYPRQPRKYDVKELDALTKDYPNSPWAIKVQAKNDEYKKFIAKQDAKHKAFLSSLPSYKEIINLPEYKRLITDFNLSNRSPEIVKKRGGIRFLFDPTNVMTEDIFKPMSDVEKSEIDKNFLNDVWLYFPSHKGTLSPEQIKVMRDFLKSMGWKLEKDIGTDYWRIIKLSDKPSDYWVKVIEDKLKYLGIHSTTKLVNSTYSTEHYNIWVNNEIRQAWGDPFRLYSSRIKKSDVPNKEQKKRLKELGW